MKRKNSRQHRFSRQLKGSVHTTYYVVHYADAEGQILDPSCTGTCDMPSVLEVMTHRMLIFALSSPSRAEQRERGARVEGCQSRVSQH